MDNERINFLFIFSLHDFNRVGRVLLTGHIFSTGACYGSRDTFLRFRDVNSFL